MKSRDSRDIQSVLNIRKKYNKQAKFSLNNNTLPWKGNTNINVLKEVTTEVKNILQTFDEVLNYGCSDCWSDF